jgi:cysteine desulfurase/selenocysteine lyase
MVLHLLKPGDEVLVSALEHHSNCSLQMLCETGAILRVIPMNLKEN